MKYQDIATLITTLTPIEKQHFKKSNDLDSDFVILFDFINKYKEYNSEKFKTYLTKKRKKNNQKLKDYSSGYLSVIKKYLYQKVMESLRTLYIPRRTPYEMFIRSLNVDILLEKGLYQLAKKEIKLAKDKSYDNSFPIEKLMILRRESIIQFYEDYNDYTVEEIHELYDSRISAAEQLLLEIKYARILTILTFQYFKGKKDKEMLQSFMDEDFMQNESLATEFATKYLYNWLKAQFAEFNDEPGEAIFYFEKSVKSWLEHPNYIKAHPKMYLGTCYTYLKYILQQKNPTDIVLKEGDLVDLLTKIPKLQMDEDSSRKHEQLFQIAQLLISYKSKNYTKVIQLSGDLPETLKSNPLTTDFTTILVHYFIASSFFHLKRFKESDHTLSYIFYNDSLSLTSNPEYYNHVLILNILVNYELRKYRYLKSEIKRAQKEINKYRIVREFEKLFFQMMLQLVSDRFKDQKDRVLERFFDRLKKSVIEENETGNPEKNMIINWVENNL